MIYSIVKTKGFKNARDEFFYSFSEEHQKALILTFVEAKFYLIEPRRIVNQDRGLECEIINSDINSYAEQKRLRKYFNMQDKSLIRMTIEKNELPY